jgi:hypothetical protein
MTYKTMFKTLYLVRIKVWIFNQSKLFDTPFSLMIVGPSSSLFVNPLSTSIYSTYKPLILGGFLKFWCFSLDLARTKIKNPSLSFKLLLPVLDG